MLENVVVLTRCSQDVSLDFSFHLLISLLESRDDILARSNTLRLSSDPAVKSIYLNPDLSREQAQLAYEKRAKRRANRTAGNHDNQRSSFDDNEHAQLSAAARSSIPVSSG